MLLTPRQENSLKQVAEQGANDQEVRNGMTVVSCAAGIRLVTDRITTRPRRKFPGNERDHMVFYLRASFSNHASLTPACTNRL